MLVALLVGVGIITRWNFFLSSALSMNEVKSKSEQFIASNLSGGKKFEIKEVSDGGVGLYRISVQLEGVPNTIESFVTKDGKLFFPNAMKMDAQVGSNTNSTAQVAQTITKSDKPNVELFVMSYCPFGTQIEKGIIPALETLGNSVNFQLKFVNYTLHGKKEFDENIKQFCIEKEFPQNLIGYLKCFNGENSDKCLTQNSISASKINDCVSATDKQYKLTELFNNESQARQGNASFPIYDSENKTYGVQGSPALVINGVKTESARDSASLLKKICDAFSNAPAVCSTKLSSVEPGPGFGNTPSSASGATGTAGCGTQ